MTGVFMNDPLQINFDQTFVEETVFLLMKDRPEDKFFKDFYNEKEIIYQRSVSADERERAFRLLYKKYFCQLGLEGFFKNIFRDFPNLCKPEIRVVVKRVWNRKHEEAELYVRPHQRTVYLGILVRRTMDLNFLESFLRHELMRISDMLAADFQYSPYLELGGKNEIENNLIRERFCLLWDLYIDARLKRKGFKPGKPYEKQKEEFKRKFFFLAGPELEQILYKLEGCESLMQIDLLHWAGDPRSVKTLGEGGLRCPLCDFTSFDPIKHWDAEALLVVNEIKKEYPLWDTSQGICPQCFDIYGLKIKAEV
ncbi:MAG: hypothetical protein A2787_01260 [Omnitrophica WOR_2 bacterium RIFCSPHIGHO2_01_FULL_48_9]|nr:MAG: hypothetical protein A2787_01260 [Omnitrophica WOR_2 bacterium RIFCSPHIGHO2_01_FULL_48_9]